MIETPEERVDFLSDEQIRDILIAIIKSIEANGNADRVRAILADWSLIERN